MKYVVLALFAVMGCLRGEDRPAREKFNEGVAALAKPDFDAAEKALLEARSSAGVDPELRFRAAYDLGLAYAAHADKVKSPANDGGADLAKALELEQQAAWWFGDALRLRGDADATANLAIVRARVQSISDELRKGEGKLEARLDALIQQQRNVLDGVRGAWREITRLAGRDPLAQQGTLVGLADTSRGIVAEAGTISDLAADEIDTIGKKPQDKREAQEQARLVQLKNLDLYIGEARARIAETRRELQDLSAETALAKAEAALVALKRAREQLDDPITILQATLQDEVALDGETHQAQVAGGSNPLDGGHADAPRLDKWLEYTALAGRQGGIRERVDEVRLRLQSAVDAHDQAPDPKAPPKPPDPKQDKLIAQVRIALPAVIGATAAMTRVHDALLDKQWKPAREAEAEAALALFAAIEQFADLKHTIDIAWGTHQELSALLQPPTPGDELAPAERGKKVHDDLTGNLARLDRIAALIADEVTGIAQHEQELAAKAAAPAPPAAGSGSAGADPAADATKQLEAQKAQLAEARARYAKAEELRARAKTELEALDKAIATNADAIGAAKTAGATLDELRKLFFDVIEHLKELVREQGETKDRTSEANAADDFSRQDMIPAIATRQDDHGKMAKAITDALGHQADALAKQGAGPPQPGQPSPAERAKAFAGAASEVRLAQNDMSDAGAVFAKSKSAAQSVSLEPATKSQASAIDHLMKALQLLQPPPKKSDQKQDKQDQDNQDQDQAKQDKDKAKQQAEKDKQAQQQGGAGQRARDEDARRQKEKRDHAKASDTVDQDW